jgi:hypothetical protein
MLTKTKSNNNNNNNKQTNKAIMFSKTAISTLFAAVAVLTSSSTATAEAKLRGLKGNTQYGCPQGSIHLLWTEAAQEVLVGGSTEALKLMVYDKVENTAPIFYDDWDVHTKVCVIAPAIPLNNNEWTTLVVEASCDGKSFCHPESNSLPFSTDPETSANYALCIAKTALGATNAVALTVLSPNQGCEDLM